MAEAEDQQSSSTTMEKKEDISIGSNEPTPSGSEQAPSSNSNPKEDLATAASALTQGKRNLLTKDLQKALSCLGEACRLYSEILSPFAAESGESHYYYGKALLENARTELSVLPQEAPPAATEGDDEDEDETEEDDEDKEDGEEPEGETEPDKSDEEENNTEAEAVEKEEDLNAPSPSANVENEAPTASKITNGTNGTVLAVDGEKPSTSSGLNASTADETCEEEPSNLELAWEVLEIAKVAYQKQMETLHSELNSLLEDGDLEKTKSEEMQKLRLKVLELQRRMADTHLLLGDVATESELYVQAEEEFRTALSILRDTERDDSREVAQCYFQLGLAYSFDKKFVEAIESFKKALALIKKRIENLEGMIEAKKPELKNGVVLKDEADSGNENDITEFDKEIAELKGLLPELEEKVADTIDAQRESLKSQEEEKMEQEILVRNSPVKNPNPPAANDISHLVKKKKKLTDDDDEAQKLEPPAKKHCLGGL